MMRNGFLVVTLAIGTLALSGCELYFGEPDRYFYCDATGCYECDEYSCFETSPRGEGSSCDSNSECEFGCYCDDGVCVEAGFCRDDEDCDPGFLCEVDRRSCVPAPPGGDQGDTCEVTEDCNGTLICAADSTCDVTCEELTRADRDRCIERQGLGECAAIFNGRNCTDPTGAPCDVPSATCTCESFVFDRCESVEEPAPVE